MSFAPQTKLTSAGLADGGYTYADVGRHVFGQEFLGAFHKAYRTAPSTAVLVTAAGDSTIVGSASMQPQWLIQTLLRAKGIRTTIADASHSGKATSDWLSTYLPTELGGAAPALYIMHYGMNDPYTPTYGLSVTQTISNLRSALALLRASWNADATSIVIVMPNTAADDTNTRTEAWREAVTEGYRRAARDYGACLVDVYGMFPEARSNLITGWLDASKVHPGDDFNALIWGAVIDAIAPNALMRLVGSPTSVTNLFAGCAMGSEPLQASAEGRLVTAQGFLIGPGTTIPTASSMCTIPIGFRPETAVFNAQAWVWAGSGGGVAANWEMIPCLLNTNGTVVSMKATTLNVARFTLDGVTWRR